MSDELNWRERIAAATNKSSYVEPKRPKPWGAILTPVTQEPELMLPNDEQMVNAMRRIHIEGYVGELMRKGGIFEAPNNETTLIVDPRTQTTIDPNLWSVIDDFSLSVWTGRYVKYFADNPTAPGGPHEFAIRAVLTDLHNSDEARQKRGETGGGTGGGGGAITPPGPLSISGTTFRTADGRIWKYRMVTAFTAFQDFLAGRDLDGYAKWTRSVGGNGWRVFYTWAITGFNPLALLGPTGLARELQNFRRYMDAQGLYGHHVAFCDQIDGSPVLMSHGDQDALLECLRGAMQGRLVEAVNEDWKNGELSGRFTPAQFAGTFGTRSSWPDGDHPDSAGSILDWTTEHTPRDAEWPRKAKNLLKTSVQGIGSFPATRKPAVGGEPIGIFEQDIPGSRTSNASDVADYFAVAELFGAGACLHGDGSTLQRCNLPGSQAQKCAEWADNARRAIPADAQLGSYTRGGLDDCPLEHDDAIALRTFAMISGNQATAVVVRPQPSWQPRARNGWAIQTISGPNGHIIGLTR